MFVEKIKGESTKCFFSEKLFSVELWKTEVEKISVPKWRPSIYSWIILSELFLFEFKNETT